MELEGVSDLDSISHGVIKEPRRPADRGERGELVEIAPIAGIRVMPVTRVRPIEAELTAAFDIEASARPGDDTYSPGGQKAAGAEEPEEEFEELEAAADEDFGWVPEVRHTENRRRGQVSFFA